MLQEISVDNREHVVNAETTDEAPGKEQLEAWTAHRTETGIVYYYNALTGQSTYEKPSGFRGEVLQALILSIKEWCSYVLLVFVIFPICIMHLK